MGNTECQHVPAVRVEQLLEAKCAKPPGILHVKLEDPPESQDMADECRLTESRADAMRHLRYSGPFERQEAHIGYVYNPFYQTRGLESPRSRFHLAIPVLPAGAVLSSSEQAVEALTGRTSASPQLTARTAATQPHLSEREDVLGDERAAGSAEDLCDVAPAEDAEKASRDAKFENWDFGSQENDHAIFLTLLQARPTRGCRKQARYGGVPDATASLFGAEELVPIHVFLSSWLSWEGCCTVDIAGGHMIVQPVKAVRISSKQSAHGQEDREHTNR